MLPTIAYLSVASIRLMDFETHKWTYVRLKRSIYISEYARYVTVDYGKVLYCGGCDSTSLLSFTSIFKSAYILSQTGEVDVLPDLISPRHSHGLVHTHHETFLFGGCFRGRGKSPTESYVAHSPAWTPLPASARHRTDFNPVVWKGEVYLCGGGCPVIETFALVGRTFVEVGIDCPASPSCIVYVWDGDLVVLTAGSRVAISAGGTKSSRKICRDSLDAVASQAYPVTFDRKVYGVRGAWCYCFDGDTGKLVDGFFTFN